MTVCFTHNPQRDWYHNVLLAITASDLPDTAAEAMEGEMPYRWDGGNNWAAGPTLSEVFQADEDDGPSE